MYDFLRNLISQPLYAFAAVFAFWFIFNLLLIWILKPSSKTWARLEYVWILVGILGILTLVSENDRNFKINEVSKIETWIETDYRSLDSYLSGGRYCINFVDRGLFSPEELRKRQGRADTICSWVKSMKRAFDSIDRTEFDSITKYPKLIVSNIETAYPFERAMEDVNRINELVGQRNVLLNDLESNQWKNFQSSFGILLLIMAFGLRLTLVSKKVADSKNKA
jgi:hypothetical protein